MEKLITASVAALLAADRPAGLDASVTIVEETATAPLERPYLEIRVEGGEHLHPRMFRGTLYLDLHTRADVTEPATAGTWHQAAVDYFLNHSAGLDATLRTVDLALRLFQPGTTGDGPAPERAWLHSQAWTIAVENIA